jgi:DNA-binding NarL/FixJ family response regulator
MLDREGGPSLDASGLPSSGAKGPISGQVLTVVGEAVQLPATTALDFDPPLDLIVVDLNASGPLEAWLIDEERPGLLLLGQVSGPANQALRGATRPWGVLSPDASSTALAAAARAVGQGFIVFEPTLAEDLLRPVRPDSESAANVDTNLSLSPREREVLQLVALGLPNKVIANRLNISEHTVKFHVAAILTRLGATSRTEAVHLGAQRGLVTL